MSFRVSEGFRSSSMAGNWIWGVGTKTLTTRSWKESLTFKCYGGSSGWVRV